MSSKKTSSTPKRAVSTSGDVPPVAAKPSAANKVLQGPAKARPGRVQEARATGGYRVFTSPVGPVHRTRSEIAAAIADLD